MKIILNAGHFEREAAYDMAEHYSRVHGMDTLPATPTMTGADLKAAMGVDMASWCFLECPRGPAGWPPTCIGDCEAVPLKDGMRFHVTPPANGGGFDATPKQDWPPHTWADRKSL